MTDENTEEASVAAEPTNAVVVYKIVEGTKVSTVVQTIGDIQVTEVQTLLELAVKGWREQIGLS